MLLSRWMFLWFYSKSSHCTVLSYIFVLPSLRTVHESIQSNNFANDKKKRNAYRDFSTINQLFNVWLIRFVTRNIAQNALQLQEWGNFSFANWNGICWGLPLQLVQLIEIHFMPHLESLCENGNLKRNFSKKVLYNPLMGYFLFLNFHFQMGIAVMGFVEHFGHC